MLEAGKPPSPENDPGKGTRRFLKRERIKKGTEIRRLLKEGNSVGCRGLKLSWGKTEGESARMGIALRRGYGNAVERNRAKRLIRENFRVLKGGLPAGFDLVFTVFPGFDELTARGRQMERLLADSGLLPRKKR